MEKVKWGYVAMTRGMKIFGAGVKFDYSGRNAFHTMVDYQEIIRNPRGKRLGASAWYTA